MEILDDLQLGAYEVKLNHRRLLDAMLDIAGVPPQKFRPICSAIDKLDKEPWEAVRAGKRVQRHCVCVRCEGSHGRWYARVSAAPLPLHGIALRACRGRRWRAAAARPARAAAWPTHAPRPRAVPTLAEMVEEKGLPPAVADKIGQFVVLRGRPLELLATLTDAGAWARRAVGSPWRRMDGSQDLLAVGNGFEGQERSTCAAARSTRAPGAHARPSPMPPPPPTRSPPAGVPRRVGGGAGGAAPAVWLPGIHGGAGAHHV